MSLVRRLVLASTFAALGCGGSGHARGGSPSAHGADNGASSPAAASTAVAGGVTSGGNATGGSGNSATAGSAVVGGGASTDAAVGADGSPARPSMSALAASTSDADVPDSEIAYSVTLTMNSFTVDPGGEVWKCQDFANPFGGQQVDIKRYHNVMNQGSHHFTLFSTSGATDGPLIDCPEGGIMAGTYTFGAQAQDVTYPLPPGIGVAIPGSIGFTMDSHYLNAGTTPLQSSVVLTMSVAIPGTVTQHAGALQAVLLSISVPPGGQPVTVGSSCTLMQDMNVMIVVSHMHHRGSHFVASTGGTTLLQTDQWSDPPATGFWPALQLKAGADFTWSCNYTNETLTTLTYGPSAVDNVMCNSVVTFYPVQDINNPLITCSM
jgi:hypothetical protein